MKELDPIEEYVERRKAEIEEFRRQQQLFYDSMTEEQKIDYLVAVYKYNTKKIKELNLSSVSEDDIR